MVNRLKAFPLRSPRAGLLFLLVAGCGGDGGNQPASPPLAIAKDAVSGDGQTDTVARALPDSFRVVVTESGAPRSGVTVTWVASAGSIAFTSNVTDVSGRAAARMTLGQVAGNFTAMARIPGGASVTFSVKGSADAPSDITAVSGDGQAALVSSGIGQPLTVKVEDRFGNVRSGIAIAWFKVTGNGSVNVASSVTSQAGIATVGVNVGSPAGGTVIRAIPAGGLDTTAFQVFAVNLIREVLLKNNFFESVANGSQQPAVDTIPAGEAIRWTWQTAAVEHDIVAAGSAFPRSPGTASPFVYGPVRLVTPGTYDYECTLHTGMIGTVVVQ